MYSSIQIAIVTLAWVVATGCSETPVTLRQFAIPARENGYSKLDSQIIASKEDLESLLNSVRDQKYWNDKEGFLDSLSEANLDFHSDVLVLVRHTEGSGTPRVWLEQPTIRHSTKEIILKIDRYSSGAGTSDMAYYCYAVVIPRSLAMSVTITGAHTSSKYIVDSEGKQQLRKGHTQDIHFKVEQKDTTAE